MAKAGQQAVSDDIFVYPLLFPATRNRDDNQAENSDRGEGRAVVRHGRGRYPVDTSGDVAAGVGISAAVCKPFIVHWP